MTREHRPLESSQEVPDAPQMRPAAAREAASVASVMVRQGAALQKHSISSSIMNLRGGLGVDESIYRAEA